MRDRRFECCFIRLFCVFLLFFSYLFSYLGIELTTYFSKVPIEAMYEVQDKVVLVTGGAAGIGAGLVHAFLEQGAKHVAALDVDVSNGEKLQSDLSSKYGSGKVKFYKCDVTSDDLVVAYEGVLEEQGYIDVVVNCAGIMNDDPKMYLKEIAVNVTALITSSLKAYDLMRKDHNGRGGTIINISSILALYKASLLPIYAATKSAVLQFSNCLGTEPHYPASGVRVITVCFGATDTTLISKQKMCAFDEDIDKMLLVGLKRLPCQSPESAVNGLIHAYKVGTGGSTWLVTSDKPAEDITENITKGYEFMSKGVKD